MEKIQLILKSFIEAFNKAFEYKGRASKFEFWSFLAVNNIILIIISFNVIYFPNSILNNISLLYSIFSIIITINLAIRRLHDINRSGIILLGYIPIIMLIILFSHILIYFTTTCLLAFVIYLFILLTSQGSSQNNEYGEAIIENKQQKNIANFCIILYLIISFTNKFITYNQLNNLKNNTPNNEISSLATQKEQPEQTEQVNQTTAVTPTIPMHNNVE